MGYTLALPCKSPKAMMEMGTFLQTNLRPFSTVCASEEAAPYRERYKQLQATRQDRLRDLPTLREDPTQYVHIGEALAYGNRGCKIGFNFTNEGIFSVYMRAVLSWTALQVGRRRAVLALAVVGHADQRVLHLTYDYRPDPILTMADMEGWSITAKQFGKAHWLVNPLGIPMYDPIDSDPDRVSIFKGITFLETSRLDRLWKEKECR